MGKSNFDILVRRYLSGEISEEEKVKLEAWMDIRKTKDTGDLELNREEAEKIYQTIVSKDTTPEELRELAASKTRRDSVWWTYRIAASILLIALVGYLGWEHGLQDGEFIKVASSGDTEKAILKDGSLVWLKGNSNLVYYNNYQEGLRYSELKGEALFEIAEDDKHPFIVSVGKATIRVVGTSFSLRTMNDSIELRVLTGTVNFSIPENKAGIDVLPYERILYGGGELVKASMDPAGATKYIDDTEYWMAFNGAPLDEVINRLEKKFDVKFRFEGKAPPTCRVTIDLTDHSLDKSLEILSDILDLTWKQHGKTIVVSGKGC